MILLYWYKNLKNNNNKVHAQHSGTTTDQHFCWRLSRSVEILKIVYKLAKHYPDVLQVLQLTVELVTGMMTKLRTDTQSHVEFTAVGLRLVSVIPYQTGWNALHKINFLPRVSYYVIGSGAT